MGSLGQDRYGSRTDGELGGRMDVGVELMELGGRTDVGAELMGNWGQDRCECRTDRELGAGHMWV